MIRTPEQWRGEHLAEPLATHPRHLPDARDLRREGSLDACRRRRGAPRGVGRSVGPRDRRVSGRRARLRPRSRSAGAPPGRCRGRLAPSDRVLRRESGLTLSAIRSAAAAASTAPHEPGTVFADARAGIACSIPDVIERILVLRFGMVCGLDWLAIFAYCSPSNARGWRQRTPRSASRCATREAGFRVAIGSSLHRPAGPTPAKTPVVSRAAAAREAALPRRLAAEGAGATQRAERRRRGGSGARPRRRAAPARARAGSGVARALSRRRGCSPRPRHRRPRAHPLPRVLSVSGSSGSATTRPSVSASRRGRSRAPRSSPIASRTCRRSRARSTAGSCRGPAFVFFARLQPPRATRAGSLVVTAFRPPSFGPSSPPSADAPVLRSTPIPTTTTRSTASPPCACGSRVRRAFEASGAGRSSSRAGWPAHGFRAGAPPS